MLGVVVLGGGSVEISREKDELRRGFLLGWICLPGHVIMSWQKGSMTDWAFGGAVRCLAPLKNLR